MRDIQFYTYGSTKALEYAAGFLKYPVLPCASASATHLLLPVPSFDSEGNVIGGGNLQSILSKLSPSVTIIGGNLNKAKLAGHQSIDLLQDPVYLEENAYITAHCAVNIATEHINSILPEMRILVIGWGRIGKHLTNLLNGIGCNVTVASRKELPDVQAIITGEIHPCDYDLIFNTAPYPVIDISGTNVIGIDLASVQGIIGDCVVARGLPGKIAPMSSGRLIAKTIERLLQKDVIP